MAIDVGGDGTVTVGVCLSYNLPDFLLLTTTFQNATFSANADGTFTVEDTVSADGKSGDNVGIVVAGWVGEVKAGFTIDWLVEAASCN